MVAHTNKLIIGDVVGAPVLLLPVDYHLGMNNCFSFIGAFPLQLHKVRYPITTMFFPI